MIHNGSLSCWSCYIALPLYHLWKQKMIQSLLTSLTIWKHNKLFYSELSFVMPMITEFSSANEKYYNVIQSHQIIVIVLCFICMYVLHSITYLEVENNEGDSSLMKNTPRDIILISQREKKLKLIRLRVHQSTNTIPAFPDPLIQSNTVSGHTRASMRYLLGWGVQLISNNQLLL